MKDDLIFHFTDTETWRAHKNSGEYSPEVLEQKGFIPCSTGYQINDTANRCFAGRAHLLLLIIDTNRVKPTIKYEENTDTGQSFPHIYGPLNLDAVLDKITLEPDESGAFDLQFVSD